MKRKTSGTVDLVDWPTNRAGFIEFISGTFCCELKEIKGVDKGEWNERTEREAILPDGFVIRLDSQFKGDRMDWKENAKLVFEAIGKRQK